jgi:hypothetical protein
MTAKLHKIIGTAMLGLALFSQGLPAWAGVTVRKEVYISPSGTDVQGSLTGARYSKDSEQYIYCSHYRNSKYNNSFAYCGARDKRGKYVLCSSNDPRIINAVKGMTDSSDLRISISSPTTGYLCTELTVSNESIYLP